MSSSTASPVNTAPPPHPLNFPLFLTARFFSVLGMMILSVAVGWHVYEMTRDPLALGYVGLAQFLPMVLLTLPAGQVADMVNRRFILMATSAVQAGAAGGFLLLTLNGVEDVSAYYALLAVFGVSRAFAGPAQQSFLPLLVPRDGLSRAVALNTSTFQVAVIIGPAIGGALVAFGAAFAYTACMIGFVVTGFAMVFIQTLHKQVGPVAGSQSGSPFSRLTAGISYVRRQPIVLGAISLDLFAVLLGGAVAMMPAYAQEILHTGPTGLGLLRSAPAVGAVLTGLWLAKRPLRRKAGPIMFLCVAGFGAGTIVFGLSENLIVSLGALFVMGATDMVSMYVRGTLIQLATPDEMRGRVSAVNLLFIGASNELGEFESGVMAALFGLVPSVVIGGVGTLVVVGLWAWMFPDLRKVDDLNSITTRH